MALFSVNHFSSLIVIVVILLEELKNTKLTFNFGGGAYVSPCDLSVRLLSVCCPSVCPSVSEELPKKSDGISPYTMALIAKYIARHRLRETQLLDTIADFLVKKAEFLDSKVRG